MNAPSPVSTASATPIEVFDGLSAGPPRRRMIVRSAIAAAALVVVGGGSLAGIHYWTIGRFQVSTDDAYVKADSTIVAPKVAGYVAQLLVDDNQPVKAGQVLARIDDRDFRTALDQASANVEAATASVANLDAQITAQGSAIRRGRRGGHRLDRVAGLRPARRPAPAGDGQGRLWFGRAGGQRVDQCEDAGRHAGAPSRRRGRGPPADRGADQPAPADARPAGACPGGEAAGGAQPGATPTSSRRSMAPSARARSASANMSRPATSSWRSCRCSGSMSSPISRRPS